MKLFTTQFFAMGSDCALHIYAANEHDAYRAATAAMNKIGRIEARYSRYRPNSELSRINATAKTGGTVEVDAETAGLLDYAYACFRKSGGLFDITSGVLRKGGTFHRRGCPSQRPSPRCWRASASTRSRGTRPG